MEIKTKDPVVVKHEDKEKIFYPGKLYKLKENAPGYFFDIFKKENTYMYLEQFNNPDDNCQYCLFWGFSEKDEIGLGNLYCIEHLEVND
jgi:hypothetical protein